MTTPEFGWRRDPLAVYQVLKELRKPTFAEAAPRLAGTWDRKTSVAFWWLEEKILGRQLPTWDQSSIGSCVSHGWGRTAQDLLLVQIAAGAAEEFPAQNGRPTEVAREPIYGGSRCEVGGQWGDTRDGSVGAWAAKYVERYGLLFYRKYPSVDLTGGYSVPRCKQWGAKGVPDELEPIAREHPVKQITLVTSTDQVFDLLFNGHGVAVCGQTSRTMKRRPGGWCPKTGNEWPHCECVRGVFMVAGGSSSPFGGDGAAPYAGNTPAWAEGNSWGDYLGSENADFEDVNGKTITLPAGTYLSKPEERARDFREGDTFGAASAVGFKRQTVDWGDVA